jgi:hypothetical protein
MHQRVVCTARRARYPCLDAGSSWHMTPGGASPLTVTEMGKHLTSRGMSTSLTEGAASRIYPKARGKHGLLSGPLQ